jgi:hypothetical protein
LTSTSAIAATSIDIRKLMPHLSRERLAWMRARVAAVQTTAPHVLQMIQNDLQLLSAVNCRLNDDKHSGVTEVAADAYRGARRGESLKPYLERVSLWSDASDRDLLWPIIASWELSIDDERMYEGLMASLLSEMDARLGR